MSVFTKVSPDELSDWLREYSIGTLIELRGIAAGIENTNYFLTTSSGRYVLTLFERLNPAELPFYLGLMAHLARDGIPCPAPIARNDGALSAMLKAKSATIVTRLPGAPVFDPGESHCGQVGATLAAMHVSGLSYEVALENPRGLRWQRKTAPQVMPFLDLARRDLLVSELEYQAQQQYELLPCGPVHGDLFRDNVLFVGEGQRAGELGRLGGVIDFYFAGVDALLFDVAVAVNDWCVDAAGGIDARRADALIRAYAAVRPLAEGERAAWPAVLRAAALRFWLSRLYDFYLPRPGELTHAHDPEHFRRILELRRLGAASIP